MKNGHENSSISSFLYWKKATPKFNYSPSQEFQAPSFPLWSSRPPLSSTSPIRYNSFPCPVLRAEYTGYVWSGLVFGFYLKFFNIVFLIILYRGLQAFSGSGNTRGSHRFRGLQEITNEWISIWIFSVELEG